MSLRNCSWNWNLLEQRLENTALDSPLGHMREPFRLTQEGAGGQNQLGQVWNPRSFPCLLPWPVDSFFLDGLH